MAMLLAEQLRQTHERGVAHGALSPDTIEIDGDSVRLMAAPPGGPAITPYSAPEVAQGKPADARSDIFSFGAVLYEMLTGHRAFNGDSPEALAVLKSALPWPSGSAAVDRVVNGCVATSPDARFQRMPKLMLELKLLMSSARRTAPPPASAAPLFAAPAPTFAPPAPPPISQQPNAAPAFNQQMQELESRISARLAEQEKSVSTVAHVANELLRALRQQQQAPPPPPAPAPRAYSRAQQQPVYEERPPARSYRSAPVGPLDDPRVEHAIDQLADRVSRMDMLLSSAVERLQKLEQNLDEFDTDAAALRDSVTRDVRNFERALKAQSTAIESARTAMAQTDDLVERVVEALDSLQSMFVSSDERSIAS